MVDETSNAFDDFASSLFGLVKTACNQQNIMLIETRMMGFEPVFYMHAHLYVPYANHKPLEHFMNELKKQKNL